MNLKYLLLFLFIFPNSSIAQEVKIDWNSEYSKDLNAIYYNLKENHAGYYDLKNPYFHRKVELGYVLAKSKSAKINSYGAYRWALREYIASFDDAHTSISFNYKEKSSPKWAGIVTMYKGGALKVAYSDAAIANIPQVGARLISCDGLSADKIAFERQGKFRGTWFLQVQKELYGKYVLEDWQNPWIKNPSQCLFDVLGITTRYKLNWQYIEEDKIDAIHKSLIKPTVHEFGFKKLSEIYWLKMPSFDAYDKTMRAQIEKLIDDVQSAQSDTAKSKAFVFDLRGNGGGSSNYPIKIANILWGETEVDKVLPLTAKEVSWRASDDNIAFLKEKNSIYAPEIGEFITKAKSEGKKFFIQYPFGEIEANPKIKQIKTKVFVVTDYHCFSSCLMAVDTFKALGAIQIGTITGADTNFMDARDVKLPSNFASLKISMNSLSGRKRRNNEPQKPDIVFDNIADDAGLLSAIKASIK